MIDLPILDNAGAKGGLPSEKKFWRSPGHLHREEPFREIAQHEFLPGASEGPGNESRRHFMKIMGASMAMAGLAACRRPVNNILPYSHKPEEIIPGIPLFYATAMPFRGVGRPLLVESHEGRPTKVEGNPDHPESQGATGLFAQASILNLYDPDRSQAILSDGSHATWQEFLRFAESFAVGAANKRLVVLSEETNSPTIGALREQLRGRFPQLRWITYAAEGSDPERRGVQMAAGRPLRPRYDFENADVIVSLDADFLGPTAVDFVHNTRSFARGRKLEGPDDGMSRLYAVESTFTLTGGMADHRKRLQAGRIAAFAAAVAAQLGAGGAAIPSAGDQAAGGQNEETTAPAAAASAVEAQAAAYLDDPFLQAVVDDLRSAGPRGVVLAGDTQPPEIHALCVAINSALGSQVVRYLDDGAPAGPSMEDEMAALVADMRAGRVDALLTIGVNPVYDAPEALGFGDALAQVENTIHLGLQLDETGQASRWHFPRAHYLEAWGDVRAYDGTLSVIQPLIAPLYADAKSEIEVLNVLATGLDQAGYDLVRSHWRGRIAGDFEKGWRRTLHDGFLPNTAYPAVTVAGGDVDLSAVSTPTNDDAFEVVFRLDARLLDGTYANNAWMQELPDPTTKIVWDNVALMSPATAEALGVENAYYKGKYIVSVVDVAVEDRTVSLPAWIQPGLPDRSVTVTLGNGRDLKTNRPNREAQFFNTEAYTDVYADGPIARGVGVNVAPMRSEGYGRVATAEVTKTERTHMIATTQEHGLMEGRPLIRMATLDTFKEDPTFPKDAVETLEGGEPWSDYPTLWENRHPTDQPAYQNSMFHKNQWGMVIDLNACTGCNACIVACNSENNVQMVGKEEVSRGREMHWLRVDRYFISEGDDMTEPMMAVQPIPCQQCENAPCESVCPVAATVHSADGTNQMIYNRCIGTRYCSNNCPYKVRRFNFFNWSKTIPSTVQMAQNPNVTVRFRGVMEKCSYCIQRVRNVQRKATLEDREIVDGEVKTACQQVCPAEAITFGDLNDAGSALMKARANPRRYEILAELDLKPRTSYLGRVRNPNRALERPRTS